MAQDHDGQCIGLQMHLFEQQTNKCFHDNVNRGGQQQTGLHKRGETFNLAVSVGVARIGGQVGNPHGKPGEYRRDQIQPGMQCFAQDSQAAGGERQKNFHANQQQRGAD